MKKIVFIIMMAVGVTVNAQQQKIDLKLNRLEYKADRNFAFGSVLVLSGLGVMTLNSFTKNNKKVNGFGLITVTSGVAFTLDSVFKRRKLKYGR